MKYRLHLLYSTCDATLAGDLKRKKKRPFVMSHVSMGSGLENMNIFILKHKWAYKAACFEA